MFINGTRVEESNRERERERAREGDRETQRATIKLFCRVYNAL